MIEIMTASAGNIVGIRATGMLTATEYDQVLVPKLVDLSHQFDELRVLFYMDPDFRGWDTRPGKTQSSISAFGGISIKSPSSRHQHGRSGACGWQVL